MDSKEMVQETEEKVVFDLQKEKKHISKLGLMFFLGTLVIMGVQIAASALITNWVPQVQENFNLSFLSMMLPMYAIGMPIAFWLLHMVPAVKPEKHNMKISQIILAFIMTYAIMYISNIIGNIITMVIGSVKGTPVTNILASAVGEMSVWVTIPIMVICAPIMEEILFRKMLVDRLSKYGEGVAIFTSALLFGLFHGNLNQFAYAFTLGLFFGFIYAKTGKVIYPIILHIAINFCGSVLSLWIMNAADLHNMTSVLTNQGADAASAMMEILPQLMIFLVYLLILFAVVITGIILLIVKRKKFVLNPGEITIPKGSRFRTVILNLGMLISIGFWSIVIIVQLFM